MRQKQFKRKIACNRRFSDDFLFSGFLCYVSYVLSFICVCWCLEISKRRYIKRNKILEEERKEKYQPVGGELSANLPAIASISPSGASLLLDERPVELTAYTINGNNYFKLRDLCALLEVGVAYSAAENRIELQTDMDYIRSAFSELSDISPDQYQFVKVYNSKYNYSVELPVLSEVYSRLEDSLTIY